MASASGSVAGGLNSNGQSMTTLSSPASSRKLPILVPTMNHVPSDAAAAAGGASAAGGGLGDNGTYVSGSLSDDGDPNAPAKHEFMISFLVDARGGSMHGCRFSGVKLTLPPKTVPQPMRICCRYVRQEDLLYPPTLNEGEEIASRILSISPAGSKFLGPVVIEVPHVASLRHGLRETAILRCDSATQNKWVEHRQGGLEEALKDWLIMDHHVHSPPSSGHSSPSRYSATTTNTATAERLARPQQFVRIVTDDFPQYFAVITRCRQEIQSVGPAGGVLQSAQLPRARVHIPPKALTKGVDVGLSIQKVADTDVVDEFMVQGGAVSSIVTIEPRRRKFHKPISITMPLPEKIPHYNGKPSTFQHHQHDHDTVSSISATSSRKTSLESSHRIILGTTSLSGNPPPQDSSQIETTLKLFCSMSGNHHKAYWEDVTDDTKLEYASGCVQFPSIVSASFWLVDCPNWMCSDVLPLVDQLYKSTMRVPYMARFVLYGKRGEHHPEEYAVRVVCLTEPERPDHQALEIQEEFKELAKSEFVEIVDKDEVAFRFGGNLEKTEEKRLRYRPFDEHRETIHVRRRNEKNPYPKGKVTLHTAANENVLFEAKIDLSKM